MTGGSLLAIHNTAFDSLPNKRRVWNHPPNSREEGLGRLVLLTPEVVAEAAKCIKSGRRIALNWELTKLDVANFNRAPCQHHIVPILDGVAYDDIYIFNPQQSSQWDGLRHFGAPDPTPEEPRRRLFYGGATSAEITDRSSTRIGIQHWAKEGICGRGVLLDYAEYAKRHHITYSSFSHHSVPFSTLLEIARDQNNLNFRRGDILFIRLGLPKEWDQGMTQLDKLNYSQNPSPQHAGIEATEEMLRWIWNEGFAAIASDTLSVEVWPPKKTYPRPDPNHPTTSHPEAGTEPQSDGVPGLCLHEYLLPGWGMPMGELFDLEGLSQLCREEGRWEFFVASSPLNMPGGVSSPGNCVAIF